MTLTVAESSADPSTSTLAPHALHLMPLGSVLPLGWLRDQLRVQAGGLTGHLDEFWPPVADSRWIGGSSEGWERAPYWLDGLVPLAVLLNDEALLEKVRRWIDYILDHQHADGWLGPINDPHEGTGEVTLDPWPQFILFKVFTQWHEATSDSRIIHAMLRAMRRIATLLGEKPLKSWARMRWADLVVSAHWLYERTGEAWILDLCATAWQQGYDWQAHFDDFTYTQRTDPAWLKILPEEDALALHGVNNAMGVKSSAVWARQSGFSADTSSSLSAIDVLDRFHGQVTGMFSGDEHLAGRSPVQGTETCTVTEYLYTLEQVLAVSAKVTVADRLERIAFNALPASMTKDMWGRQYDQQPNQVLVSRARRSWISNNADSNLFSLEGNFGCCTANMHQGWPKFAASLWMRPSEGGLAAVAYAPCEIQAEIDGAFVTITEETEYPFRGAVKFTVGMSRSAGFPLLLRIPAWAEGATVIVNGSAAIAAPSGEFYSIDQQWRDGDTVVLDLPLHLRVENRDIDTVSVARGPLVMALRIGEDFRQVGGEVPHADLEVHPSTYWNYALNVSANFDVLDLPVSAVPFSSQHPPVLIVAEGQMIPEWVLENDSAAPPPPGPAYDAAGTVEIKLVPYGSTYLRISEFPSTK